MIVNYLGQKRKNVKLDIEYFKSRNLDRIITTECINDVSEILPILNLPWGASVLSSLPFSCNLQWMNDIENDPAYLSWPAGVQELLRATFPGVIRQIRRNFFNLVSSPKP